MVRASRGLRRGSLAAALLLLFQVVAVVMAPAALAAPAISSCTPTSGPVGTVVTITGTDLSGVNRVEFNGTDADFTKNQAGTQITATVPAGATDGPVTVTDNGAGGGVANCPSNFDVTPTQTPTVTGFSPTSGPVGTSVVITGTNFTGATAVRFNGTSATFTVNSPTQITATVPSGATDGPIAVQNSAGTGTSAGSFDVTAPTPPTITGFSPTSGAPGTSVVITGTNFTGATAVRFGGTTATFTVNSSTQITATVPAGAATGAISVTTPSGTATSSSSFTVTQGGPAITSFSPASGCVGTNVTINGSNFTGATAVTFNGVSATSFTVQSSTRINAVVPVGATTGKIAVTSSLGTGTSATNFTVGTACSPTISSFTPSNGPVGTTVIITGDDFTGTITVKFDGVNAPFTVNSDSQITTTVPTGATTGKITVTNGNGTGTSATDFVVTGTPTITSFTPASGPVGSTVTITGTNFSGITAVRFNGTSATFTVNSLTQITATVPEGATTGRITITNSAGTATSATDFTVTPPAPTVHARSVSLALRGHLRASGNVVALDNFQACEVGVAVKIQRRKDGVWRTLKTVTTDATGHFATNLRDRRGLYRARAVRLTTGDNVCARTTSPRRRHRH